ncbi:uncharacterized protein F5147DRAFT_76766 [Suillus discolor]|uniref:Uncharacterized protein n=1 Tax=Suillus discolor TaxID=1912936 RepID=A0A9P7ESW7_9AGAM|nr:uncharacterized protein F5147DRAFT_76766 [Suillus discolor]KAG2086605.1 hypothetical protein F5147DRAFT_76766 [Suillus discolor]
MILSVLTLEREIELIWVSGRVPYQGERQQITMNSRQRQRWSLMTVLYMVIRYIGLPYTVISVLPYMPMVSLTDAVSDITKYAISGTNVVVPVMLGVIIIARLYSMYQGSRAMLIFLVIVFLTVTITCGVNVAIMLKDTAAEELILSGTHMCAFEYDRDAQLLYSIVWMLYTAWEGLALCLSIWTVVKHFHYLRRLGTSTGSTVGDCFRVLIQSHVLYFVSFTCVSCLQLLSFPEPVPMGVPTPRSVSQIFFHVQMFVLGPRLILSVRQYHAELVANFDDEISMNSIILQERVHIQTSSTM